MVQAAIGDTVKVHYTGKLENGLIFDCTKDRGPFEVKIGSGQTVPGFEMGLPGMAVGDKRTLTIKPEDGFGFRDEELKEVIRKQEFPDNLELKPGLQLMVPHPDGDFVRAVVADIKGEEVTLDLNHPLAGWTLIFEVEMIEIQKGEPETQS